MYQRKRRYEWIAWEKPEGWQEEDLDFTGFRARILANPTAGDVNHESSLFTAIARDMSNRELIDELCQGIADRVPEWEYTEEDDTGELVNVPAPGESDGNWQAFYLLEPSLFWWLVSKIRTAHLPKAKTRASKPASTTVPETLTTTDPEPERPTS